MASAPLDLPLSKEKLDEINVHLANLTPEEILKWAVDHLPGLYQTTAFGLTGLVAIDMLSKITSAPPPLIFLDTLYHFPETYQLVEDVKTKYNVPIHVYKPEGCCEVTEFEAKYGEKFWETDEATYDYLVKVEPAQRAYEALGVKAVITGRRASQGADRASLQPLEVDSTGLLKLNPLYQWNFHLVEWYITENKVPRNQLLDQGYRSVGDWHSTTKVAEGQDERAGRWAGKEKSECGLHKDYFAMKAQAKLVADPQIHQNTFPSDLLPQIFPVLSLQVKKPRYVPQNRGRPDFGPNNRDFPPLPSIHSRDIEQKVYTHRSYYARPTHVFEDHPSDPSPDNEKFEHLGDAVLGLCVTNLLMQMYPGLHVGPSTVSAQSLYGMPHQHPAIRGCLDTVRTINNTPSSQKIRALIVGNATLADMSSYIGGLYHEQGLDAVRRWLEPLFRPYAISAYQSVRLHHGLPMLPTPNSSPKANSKANELAPMTTIGHLALFNQYLQKSDRSVEWIYSDAAEEGAENEDKAATHASKTTPVWYVKVLVDGVFYGKGRGNTKKAARNEAAKVGLQQMGINVWCVGSYSSHLALSHMLSGSANLYIIL
ncbi:hypothetical protein H0H87_000753 [Tephrocybe sp. NHM501043]|nr:hypothetical protein H0H87_000753 [Tephrocybe sp. NHM501043]